MRPKLLTSFRGYDRRAFLNDAMAGIIVGIVALPLAIAFAIASGVSPDRGLVTAVVAGFIISVLSGSRVNIGFGVFLTLRPVAMMMHGDHGVTVGAVAQSPGATQAPQTMVMVQAAFDPSKLSCSPKIDPKTAAKTTYEAKTYFFCSAKERDEFLTNPAMSLSMMNKRWIVAIALAGALVVPSVARAHEGHAHKVMGTVSSVDGNNLMVKTADGKTVMVMLDKKTAITRGKTKLDAASVKVGDRVVAEGIEEKDMIMAKTVKLGEVAPAVKK